METFWLVWSPTGTQPPSRRYGSRHAAQEEAERLARSAELAEFFVLEAVSRSKKIGVVTEQLKRDPEDAEIPF